MRRRLPGSRHALRQRREKRCVPKVQPGLTKPVEGGSEKSQSGCYEVVAYTAGKLKKNRVKTLVGDRVPSKCRPGVSGQSPAAASITRAGIWREVLELVRLPLPLLRVQRGRSFDRDIWPDSCVFRIQRQPFLKPGFAICLDGIHGAFGSQTPQSMHSSG